MTGIITLPSWFSARTQGWLHRPLGELGAPVFVVGYLLMEMQPFSLVLPLPGLVSSGMLPALAIVTIVCSTTPSIRHIPAAFVIPLLLGWLGATYLWAATPLFTMSMVRGVLPGMFLAYLVVGTLKPEHTMRLLLGVFGGVAVWSLLTSLVLPTARAATLGPDGLQQGFRGTFLHKNLLGITMVYGLSLLLSFARGRTRAIFVWVTIGAILLTRSATAASGMAVVLAVTGILTVVARAPKGRDRTVLGLVSVAALIIAVVFVLGLLPELLGVYGKDMTFTGRTDVWTASWHVIVDRPFHGYGIDGVWSDGNSFVTRRLHGELGYAAAHAHNGGLNLLLEAGLVGLGLFVVLLVRTLRLGAATLVSPRTSAYGRWAITTISALVMMSLGESLYGGFSLVMLIVMWTVLARLTNDMRHGRDIADLDVALRWWRVDDGAWLNPAATRSSGA